MQISETGYAILAASILVAGLIDFVVVRTLLEFLRPASRYVFLTARVGKLSALLLWLVFFNNYWYPQYAVARAPLPDTFRIAEVAVVALLVLLALVTIPRAPRGASPRDA